MGQQTAAELRHRRTALLQQPAAAPRDLHRLLGLRLGAGLRPLDRRPRRPARSGHPRLRHSAHRRRRPQRHPAGDARCDRGVRGPDLPRGETPPAVRRTGDGRDLPDGAAGQPAAPAADQGRGAARGCAADQGRATRQRPGAHRRPGPSAHRGPGPGARRRPGPSARRGPGPGRELRHRLRHRAGHRLGRPEPRRPGPSRFPEPVPYRPPVRQFRPHRLREHRRLPRRLRLPEPLDPLPDRPRHRLRDQHRVLVPAQLLRHLPDAADLARVRPLSALQPGQPGGVRGAALRSGQRPRDGQEPRRAGRRSDRHADLLPAGAVGDHLGPDQGGPRRGGGGESPAEPLAGRPAPATLPTRSPQDR